MWYKNFDEGVCTGTPAYSLNCPASGRLRTLSKREQAVNVMVR
jgi:hypothetical protein